MNENVNVIIKARDEAARTFNKVGNAGSAMAASLSRSGAIIKTSLAGAFTFLSVERTIRLTRNLMDAYAAAQDRAKEMHVEINNIQLTKFQATATAVDKFKGSIQLMKFQVLEALAGPMQRFANWGIDYAKRWGEGFKTAIDLFKFFAASFGDMMKLVFWEGTYWITKWALDTAYWFTNKLPAYLSYLKDQWANIFLTIYEGTKTVFANLWDNIKSFFMNVWNWMNGDETDWRWTGLLTGFQSTIDDMKPIAERMATSFEQQLASDIAGAKARIVANFGNIVGKPAGAESSGSPAAGINNKQNIGVNEARFLGTVAGGNTPADKTASNTARLVNNGDKILRVLEDTRKLLERLGGQSVVNPPWRANTVSIIK